MTDPCNELTEEAERLGLYGALRCRPGSMTPPSDTRPVLWRVTAWLDDRPRVEVYDTTWTDKEALMRAYAQVRADASLPPDEWRQYSWTVLRADEAHLYRKD